MSTLQVETIKNPTSLNTVNSEQLVQGSATAWVNFNGTGTVAIRDSYNVSSITDTGVGRYDINYGITMGNNTYVSHLSSNTYGSDTATAQPQKAASFLHTTTNCKLILQDSSSAIDPYYVSFTMFGGL